MTNPVWTDASVIVVSEDVPRAAVLAARFPEAELSTTGARAPEPGQPLASCLVVLADADAAAAVTRLAPRLTADAVVLVESTRHDRVVPGRQVTEHVTLDGFELDVLEPVGAPPRPAGTDAPVAAADDTPAGTTPDTTAGTPTAAGKSPTATSAGAGAPAATAATGPAASSGRRDRDPDRVPAPPRGRTTAGTAAAAGGAVLVVVLVVAVVVAQLTTTGYVGFTVTALALAGAAALAGLALLQRRGARALRASLEADRARERSARSRLERRLADVGTGVQADTAALAARVEDVERTLTVVTASALETARRLPEPRGAETFTDPAELQAMHQTQAVANLFALVPVRGVIPFMGGWAASPDLVVVLVQEVLTRRPALVVECGSGVSTLWMALVIDHFGLETRIVSLDHDPEYAEQTRQTLRDHGVAHVAEVRDAPLGPAGLEGHDTDWYAVEAIEDLHDIGLLFVDGPPDTTGPLVRLPAVPLLRDRLAPRASVVLDDAVRAGEQEVTTRWQAVLPDFTLTRLSLQKQASRLRRG
ncbi:class I SAM-dependent methyltransferase [Terrabacter sp. NPDC000476]|uniref:O-methyltransferase n=1 Tax=Terrabacter sp. NPDC000476 TaxID=3154258 RepID=UPI0033283123